MHEELEPERHWWHWSIPDPVEAGDDQAFDAASLWGSAAFVALTWLFALRLPPLPDKVSISLAPIDAGD